MEKLSEVKNEIEATERVINKEIDRMCEFVTPSRDIFTNEVRKNDLIGIVLSIRNMKRHKQSLVEELEKLNNEVQDV